MPAALILLLGLLAAPQEQADDRYNFLVGLSEKGMHDLAVREAESFLDDFPRHPKADLARYRLADALYELGRLGDASVHYRQLAARAGFEYQLESSFRFGQCELELGRLEAAVAALQPVATRQEHYLRIPALFLVAEAEFRRERFDAAEQRYLEVLAAEPEGEYAREALYGACWCAFRLARHDAAVQRIETYLRAYPDAAATDELRFLLGESHLEAGRPQDALAAYRRVRDGAHADAALRGAGFALVALGDHAAAAREFGRLLESHPDSVFLAEVALQRGVHLLKAGQAREALAALCAPQAGETAEVLYWRAQAASACGEPEQAMGSLERALRSRPSAELSERIQVLRGDLLFQMGRMEEAVAAYGRSESDYALHAAAVASLNQQRPEEAATLARRLLAQFPRSSYAGHAQLTLGEALLAVGRTADAEKAFLAAAAALPQDGTLQARALSRLGWCRYLQDDPLAAAGLFAQVVSEHPEAEEAEEAAFMTGRSLEAAGEHAAAVDAWTRYLERYGAGPHHVETQLRLARLADPERAVDLLESVRKRDAEHPLAAQALLELAERHDAAGRAEPAEACYRELLERFPQSESAGAACYGLGWLLCEAGRPAEAAAVLGAGLQRPQLAGELRLATQELHVWSLSRAGDLDAVEPAWIGFAAACGDEGRRLESARTVIAALRAGGRLERADELLARELERARDRDVSSLLLVERSYLAQEAGRLEPAEEQVRAAQRLAPRRAEVAEACFFVAEGWFTAGEYARAVALYELARAHPTVADRALYKQGFAHLRLEDPQAAAGAFRSLVEEHPDSELLGEGLFLLGEALFRDGRYEEAIAPLARLRSEQPRHQVMPKALFRLGIALCHEERHAEAETTLADLARRFPEFENGTEAELWRGRALAETAQPRAARQALERVIARDRGVLAARARLELGRLDLAAGNHEQALAEFLKVAVLFAHEEEVAEGYYYAGLCLEALGDAERAATQYQEILEKHPKTKFAVDARQRLEALRSQ